MLSIRKIGMIGRTYRHINRYSQILGVLFGYGFGELIDVLRIDQLIGLVLRSADQRKRDKIEKLTRPERVRMALEELGPTYVKLGQLLSTRPDLLPADYIRELGKLQDKATPFPFEEAIAILNTAFPFDSVFKTISPEPIAAASIAQVYDAVLKSEERVAVKIQRPGIRRIVEIDLEIMLHLATLMEHHIEEVAFFQPVKLVDEFARVLEKEIDFTVEANNMERVSRHFIDDPTVYVPAVFREFSTPSILVMERIDGIKISDIEAIEKAGLNKKLLTIRGADVCLKQIFEHGFFHADPHPGNLLVLPDNVICMLDLGMVGALDQKTREDFIELVDSVVLRQEGRAARAILKLTDWDHEPQMRSFERDVADFMSNHLYRPLKEIRIGKLFQDVLDLAFRHRLRVPADIFLMLKALATVEGVAQNLDPDFDMISHAAPYIRKIRFQKMAPGRMAAEALYVLEQGVGFVRQFPQDILEISKLIRQQRLTVNLRMEHLERILSANDRTSNRIAFSILIAGLVIGSALIVISETPPLVFGISLIGFIGFAAAVVLGIWLLAAIIRKGRL
ncbi:MAG: AarF/ABC1/UbiB kinase family protein [Thermodesulfobacteriota bacterium]